MSLRSASLDGWRINRINAGPPYHVELVGPYRWPKVEDARGVCALSGPYGAVFCTTIEQAEELCRRANAGELERVNATEKGTQHVIAQWIVSGIDRDTPEQVMEVAGE